MMSPPVIRMLTPDDAEAFRSLRLEGLGEVPTAFGSSVPDEIGRSVEAVRSRMPVDGRSAIFGAFAAEQLAGIAGFAASEAVKLRHKGTLWGVFVTARWRRHGLGEALLRRVIAHAGEHVLVLQATTALVNEDARRLYHRLGFRPYGIEPRGLLIDGVFYDEELLVLDLD